MKLVNSQTEPHTDDSHEWIGGEATVNVQARRHVSRQAGPSTSFLGLILGLTFFSGLTLGSSIGLLCRNKRDS